MLLTQLDMAAADGFEQAESDIVTALRGAVDNNGVNINVTVDLGFDAEIADAIMVNPQPDMMPLVRLNIWQDDETLAMGGGPVWAKFYLSLYFYYYFGVPSLDPVYSSFVTLRRRHLALCMRAIMFPQPGVTSGIPTKRKWKWDSSLPRSIDYVAPFKYLDRKSIYDYGYLKQGYNCTRMDCPILILTAQ